MTNHSYFNLAGDPSKTSTDNIMYVNADYYTPVDSTFMTTGEITLGQRYSDGLHYSESGRQRYQQLRLRPTQERQRNDHNWVLNTKGDISQVAARLTSPESGITSGIIYQRTGYTSIHR